MKTYLVTLKMGEHTDLAVVEERLRSFPKWAKVMPNVWIVRHGHITKEDVRSYISDLMPDGAVLVINIDNAAWATYSVDKEVTDWMQANV